MRPGFQGLPDGCEKWSAKQWRTYHAEQAEAIGCVYRPDRVENGPLLIAQALTHTEAAQAGKPFRFLPWFEHRIVHPFYGYIDPETDLRRYRQCYLFVAKKNAKTTSMGPLILHHLVNDGERGARVYSAAGSKEQASEVYEVAAPMAADSPVLSSRLTIRDANKRIVFPATHSFYQVLSAEVHTKHGMKPSCVHFDELHAQPNRFLWEVLTKGAFAARIQPALLVTSTAGYDRNGVCFDEWDYARKVDQGIVPDPQLLPVIYEVPEGADWKDEENWCLANPSMGTLKDVLAGRATVDIDNDMRSEFRKAIERPVNENAFRMLRLNQWVSQETRYIPMHKWDACTGTRQPLRGRPHFGGQDLSTTTDITAYVRVAWDGDFLDVWGHYWLPKEGIEERERKDRAPYREWEREGWMTLTDGNVVDYASIRRFTNEHADADGRPVEIGFDPWNATQLCEVDLPGDGFDMVPVRQGYQTLSAPTKRLLELVLDGRLRTGGDPVMRWAADNVMATFDPAGNVKPDKSKSRLRIDPIVALVVALDRASRYRDSTSIYETRGFLTL